MKQVQVPLALYLTLVFFTIIGAYAVGFWIGMWMAGH